MRKMGEQGLKLSSFTILFSIAGVKAAFTVARRTP
jgi:hypothetical protein